MCDHWGLAGTEQDAWSARPQPPDVFLASVARKSAVRFGKASPGSDPDGILPRGKMHHDKVLQNEVVLQQAMRTSAVNSRAIAKLTAAKWHFILQQASEFCSTSNALGKCPGPGVSSLLDERTAIPNCAERVGEFFTVGRVVKERSEHVPECRLDIYICIWSRR